MKRNSILLFTLLAIIVSTASSCEAIGDIFKAGVWVGVIIVVLVIGVILWLVGKAKK
ncbi:MAG: phosphatidate cytidylyltransferase [Ginsengibacter sp.]